jgi:hypothetical protein
MWYIYCALIVNMKLMSYEYKKRLFSVRSKILSHKEGK